MARFISTSIPYVNARPHIGHALEYIEADAYARALRGRGEEVFFLTGTDDNALKNVQAAEQAGKSVQELVDEHSAAFREFADRFGVSYETFVRTSNNPAHVKAAQTLWAACAASGDLYRKSYEGFYCVGCEEFKTEKDLVNGECPLHPGRPLERVQEENWFFKLSNYQEKLEAILASGDYRVIPDARRNEMLAFVRGGLEDFSVSRSTARAKGWGIPVPGDETQIMYVWFDALVNYLTGAGYPDDFAAHWSDAVERTHFVGKDITRFHAIYWPAMLLSAGVPLPTTLFSHGFITSGGQKMSKSLGNVIDPISLADTYGVDAVRYLLLRQVSPFEDSDLTLEGIKDAYNGNLVNGLGNLVARVMKLSEEHLPAPVALTTEDTAIEDAFMEKLLAFRFHEAMDLIFEHVGKGDAYMTAHEPYKKIKDEATRGVALADIEKLVRHLAKIAAHLAIVMPTTASAILAAIAANTKPENLFPRVS